MTQCIVTINYTEDFLLPKKQALLLVDLICQSKVVIRGYGKSKDEAGRPPAVQLVTVNPEDLEYPEQTTQEGTTP